MRTPLISSDLVNESFASLPPEKFDFPSNSGVVPENINMNCTRIVNQIIEDNQKNTENKPQSNDQTIVSQETENELDYSINQNYKDRYLIIDLVELGIWS